MNELAPADHARLVARLLEAARYHHPVTVVRLIETHISSILLTGAYAYKLKKPLRLSFLDFSTLARRRECCAEEVRLNRRLAPEVYLGVVPILGSVEDPRLAGEGEAIEYAVKMREFPQAALLDAMLMAGEIDALHIDQLAEAIAGFHAGAERAAGDSPYGSPTQVLALALENFDDVFARLRGDEDRPGLQGLLAWTRQRGAALSAAFAARKRDGFVRECHGDLHLGNIAWVDGRVQAFDGIEFNEGLRWIDVASDVAFLFMDLSERGHPAKAWRFLNRYLERAGDYGAMAVLEFYLVYRALVRAKVSYIRSGQEHLEPAERKAALAAFHAYLRYAEACTIRRRSVLIITHGFSGSGKTQFSQMVLERVGAIRLRADVERKRLHGLRSEQPSASPPDGGIYGPAATQLTYEGLVHQARRVLASGFPVILDGTFLSRWQRSLAQDLADSTQSAFLIVDCQAPTAELCRRVAARQRVALDASEATVAVLERQMDKAEPLSEDEMPFVLRVDTVQDIAEEAVARVLGAAGFSAGSGLP